MSGGKWDPTSLPIQPGLYINFQKAAIAAITGGARGIVAVPLLTYGANAKAKTFYTVETEKDAQDLFGSANIRSILFALQGGAKEVLVYTMPATPTADDYVDMRDAFDARDFNVFAFDGEYNVDEQAKTKTWVKRNRDEGKHFLAVIGGDATTDADPTQGNARSTLNSDDYIANLISGAVDASGNTYTSSEFAPYIAGLIAGTAINDGITNAQVDNIVDVTKRLTNPQFDEAIKAGSLVLFVFGNGDVRVKSGLVTSGEKIRAMRAQQSIATDITTTAVDSYIGKLDNNVDGQTTLMVAIKAYLENLEVNNVLTAPSVGLDPNYESTGDKVFLLIGFNHVDSIERIFLTINV
jgi:hypothetical protein